MKIVTIIGARPQFIKATTVSRVIMHHNLKNPSAPIQEYLVHTGQHYDKNMSDIFFQDLKLPQPFRQLNCGNGSHAQMTADMMMRIESVLLEVLPDYVLVYGDTNSTLAGALTAAKLHIPVIHVEAGLRSYNMAMPEEINRRLTDHLSSLLFCPTSYAVECIKKEGICQGVHHVGDVMYDAAILFGEIAELRSKILSELNLTKKSYDLCTIHRQENTADKQQLFSIFAALRAIGSDKKPVVIPLHPGTQKKLEEFGLLDVIRKEKGIHLIEPVGFLDMILLEKNASHILTDSGGIQKEAYFHRTPCITLRNETEWIETLEARWNQLAGHTCDTILDCYQKETEKQEITEYGDGDAAQKILSLLQKS